MKTPREQGDEPVTAGQVSYHETVNVLQGMIGKNAAPFDRAEWFALLQRSGAQPLVAVAGEGDDRSALALMRQNGRLEALHNWYNFTWRPHGADSRALTVLAADLLERTHRVTLSPVPDEDGSASLLESAFREAGWHVRREQCDHNHVLPVRSRTFAEYWAQRPGRMRTTVKRKAKKVEVTISRQFDENEWAQYEAIYADSWKPEEGDRDLLRNFAEAEAAAGRLRLGIARHDGEAVAAQFWTVENSVAYIHKLAHLESHPQLSAGTTLSAALFEHVIDRDKVELVDFGTGNDAYKRDWMEVDRPRYRIDCLNPRAPRAWPALVKRKLRSALHGGNAKAKGSDRTAGEQPPS